MNDIFPENMSNEELQYHKLAGKILKAKNKHDEKVAWNEFHRYQKEHPKITDEIQSRRWLIS
jgi:hypothetical protein